MRGSSSHATLSSRLGEDKGVGGPPQPASRSFEIGQRKAKKVKPSVRNIQKLISMPMAVTALALLPFAPSLSSAAGPASTGEPIYKARCSICHGADGAGHTSIGKIQKVPDLRSPEVQRESDVELTEIITHGKKKMQAYNDRLTPEQIQQLVAYLRELGKKKYSPVRRLSGDRSVEAKRKSHISPAVRPAQ